MQIQRIQTIESELKPKRVLIVYGPRRIGKTTMVKAFAEKNKHTKMLFTTGDDVQLQTLLNRRFLKEILQWALPYDLIIIDEAQYIRHIGQAIKMVVDAYPEKQIILTGSSSFEIAQHAGEPLTGRHFTMTLLPLMQQELERNDFERKSILEDILIFGAYPEVLLQDAREEKRRVLEELVHSYLLKDILALDNIKSPTTLLDILRALAFQVGNEVSFSEIANVVGKDTKTVQRYIDILEKTFVIHRVRGYNRNMRNEISKKSKFYFYDLGVRNALVNQYNTIALRNDVGALWENFVFMELYKKSQAEHRHHQFYFWRTHQGAEVDIVAEKDGEITAYECKWSERAAASFSKFLAAYPAAKTVVVHSGNYLDVLSTALA